MSTLIAANNALIQPVSVHLLPSEGPKSIPLVLDFTGAILSYAIDLSMMFDQQYITMLQSIFIDLSDPSLSNLSIQTSDSNSLQTIVAKAQTQGYYQILVPNPPKLIFTASAAGGIARIALLNIAVPGSVWPTV